MLLSNDATIEEVMLLQLVKRNMLEKLEDREKFLFVYVFEMGNTQSDAAIVLGIHETNVARRIKRIREKLTPFKKGL